MRVELLEKILKKKDKIREYLQQNIEKINEEDIKSKWVKNFDKIKPYIKVSEETKWTE